MCVCVCIDVCVHACMCLCVLETTLTQGYYSQRKGRRICFSMDNDLKVIQLLNQDHYNSITIQLGWLKLPAIQHLFQSIRASTNCKPTNKQISKLQHGTCHKVQYLSVFKK